MTGALLVLALLGCFHASKADSILSPFSSFSRTGFEDCDSDVIFVIDESGSIAPSNYAIQLEFIKAVVEELDKLGNHDIIYGAVTFTTGTDVEISLADRMGEAEFASKIITAANPQKRSTTNTHKGINAALKDFSDNGRVGANRIVVLFTDGYPDDANKAAAAAKDAKENYNVRLVGVCTGCYLPQLQSMVSEPTENNIISTDFSRISEYTNNLVDSICPPRGRKRCECDMIFVMDGSGSISYNEGVELVDFVKEVVGKLGNLGGNDIHYGSVVFATHAAVRISLAQGMEAQAFINAVSLDRSGLGSVTKTHLGIQEASLDFHDYGRNNSCWLMIILSDGEPCCDEGDDELAKLAAIHAKAEDAEIFSVCVAPGCDEFQLKEMVSEDVEDHYLQAEDTSKLNDYVRDLVELLCPDPCFETPADVVFMLDHSGSLTRNEFTQLKNFVAKIASKVASSSYSVRIGAVTFGSRVTNVIKLTAYEGSLMKDLDDAINALVYGGGGTDFQGPLQAMIDMFNDPAQERHGASRIGVMVSDFYTSSESAVKTLVDKAKLYEGVQMVSLSIGRRQNPALMQYMASEPKEDHVYQVCDCGDLDAIVNLLIKLFCIPSYCTHVPVDVVFVIDRSGSVEDLFMPMVKDFLKDVYARLDIYTDDFRLGAVVYTGSAYQAITLDNQSNMMAQIDSLPDTTGGWTNTNAGLEKMIEQFTLYGNEVAQWVGVVMTDGGDWGVANTANDARAMSIKIIAMEIGEGISTSGMNELVGPGGKVLTIKSYTAIRSVMTSLVKFFCPPCEPVDVIFVADGSTSTEADWNVVVQFFVDMANGLLEYPDNRVGGIVYSSQAFEIVTLQDSADKDAFMATVMSYNHVAVSGSRIGVGINQALVQFQSQGRPDVEKIMVVLTDGHDPMSHMALGAAEQARNLGIRTVVVALTKYPNMNLLRQIASHPYSKYTFAAPSIVSLMKIEMAVKRLLCSSPCKDKLAVVFAIDKSYSIHEELYIEAKDLVRDVADILFDNAPNVIMGATIFDGVDASTALYNNPAAFNSALSAIAWPLQDYTNMASSLNSAASLASSAGSGYDPVVVLLSDGSATDGPNALFTSSIRRTMGARIITVGIGPDVNEWMMSKLASSPVYQNSLMSKGESLRTLTKRLAKLICPVSTQVHKEVCGEQLILKELSMCCDGVVQKRPVGVPGCCGQVSYNLDTQTCCNNAIQDRSMADRMTCPSKDCYDETEYICCKGGMTAINGRDMDCCGSEPFDKENFVCCNGVVTEKVLGGNACCWNIHYSTLEAVCCNGILNTRVAGTHSYFCCGQNAIFTPGYCCSYYWWPPMVYTC